MSAPDDTGVDLGSSDADDEDFDEDDETYDDDQADDDEVDDDEPDEVGAEGNRVVGGRAQAVVEHIARYLADEPEAVEVDSEERRGTVTINVHTAPDDTGRLIGRRGRVIQAVRQIARAAGSLDDVRVEVEVAE